MTFDKSLNPLMHYYPNQQKDNINYISHTGTVKIKQDVVH
jgi:hypothetical protein